MTRWIIAVSIAAVLVVGYSVFRGPVYKEDSLVTVTTGATQVRSGYELLGGPSELCFGALSGYIVPYNVFGFDGSIVLTRDELQSLVIDPSSGSYDAFSGDIRIGYITGMMTGGYSYGTIMLQELQGVLTLGAYGQHDGVTRYTIREFTGAYNSDKLGLSQIMQDYKARKQDYASSSGIWGCQYLLPLSGGLCDALYVRVMGDNASYAHYYTEDPVYTIDCFATGQYGAYRIHVGDFWLPDPMTPVSESVLAQKVYNRFVISLFGMIRK
ncbi:MAG: hypothetical protein WC004_00845 [Candidatus Absconditabacterales bacterium]